MTPKTVLASEHALARRCPACPPRKRNAKAPIPVQGIIALALVLADGGRAAVPESYRTSWSHPEVNARIERGIEQFRKGDCLLEVVDAAGKPVPDARVEARQTRHEFLFGCNAFVLGQLKPEDLEQRYEAAFARLFNFATVPFYWEGLEPARGELRYAEPARDIWRRPPPDRFLPFAAKHGITLKGHPLLWHAYNPAWLPKDANELRELYRKRFREISRRYADKISIWDVVNESLVCTTNYPLYSPAREYVGWAFQEVAPLFPPQTILMINEVTGFNFRPVGTNPYLAQIRQLLDQGAAIRGIGFQYHYMRREALDKYLAGKDCSPQGLLDLYEEAGRFGLPLYITEITFPSAGQDGEELQAAVVRDHYRLWFSVPRMAGITWWNLGDGTAVKGENEALGGLLDAQFQSKAAYRALDQLINETWKTRAQVQTDPEGKARFRGFYGKYRVVVQRGGQTRELELSLTRGGTTPARVVLE
ncbi:MAG: endo-1,4-beta-xylanase [Verrucomicrobia bacterium]|nr:endo-1,4-beta-xylanase [Verrucomicrobiota bacterium]OQC24392.1 MAG: Endo-1,4-beta-xylanase B [Verrucomicrobia bacterium ADurb.Bin063]HCL92237.1 glycoside hydrolase family 10 [Limisphaerales bacterium]HRY58431.1 endo-1,4-beta-xylanase [Candidatus Paceibacterota bacterium]HNR70284.1 endo-1,4-beta-xylanase [Verrucomicrobiota bacterium]